MTINELNILKTRLSQYRSYKTQIVEQKQKVDEYYRLMAGIHSPSLEGIHISGNASSSEQRRLDISEKIERCERSISNLEQQIEELDIYIDQLPKDERMIAIEYYKKGKPFYLIGKKMYLDKTSVIRRLYKALIKLEFRG